MYTILSEAKNELQRRKADIGLVKVVREYVGQLPEAMETDVPLAVYCPYVATPNLQTRMFMILAQSAGFRPILAEYLDDIFVWQNPDKKALVRLVFNLGVGRNGGPKTSIRLIADPKRIQRVYFNKIYTLNGQSLVDFHHGLLESAVSGAALTDFSAFYRKHGGKAKEYYCYLMAAFTCFGVMFENFLDSGNEAAFVEKIVKPAIKLVKQDLGISPLIVRYLPPESENSVYWTWYPAEIERLLQ